MPAFTLAFQLDDGTVFVDSSQLGGKFNKTGETEVMLGMRELFGSGGDIGLVSMRPGERALITCDSEFALGDAGVDKFIPANSRLTFDVTLLEVVSSTTDLKKQLVRSVGGGILVAAFIFLMLYFEGAFEGRR